MCVSFNCRSNQVPPPPSFFCTCHAGYIFSCGSQPLIRTHAQVWIITKTTFSPRPPPPPGISSFIMFNNLMYQNITNGNSVFIGSVISISYDFLSLQQFYFPCFLHFFQLFPVVVFWSDIGILSYGVSHDST